MTSIEGPRTTEEVPLHGAWTYVRPQTVAVATTLTVRAGALGISLLLNVLLARVLGARGAGVYFLFITWTTLLGTGIALGLPMFALRSVAQLNHRQARRAERRLVLRAAATIVAVGTGALLAVVSGSERLSRLLFNSPSFGLLLR